MNIKELTKSGQNSKSYDKHFGWFKLEIFHRNYKYFREIR